MFGKWETEMDGHLLLQDGRSAWTHGVLWRFVRVLCNYQRSVPLHMSNTIFIVLINIFNFKLIVLININIPQHDEHVNT
jgi:hypothetical protein